MKKLTWFAMGLLLLGFQPVAAETCPSGHPGALAYIRRDGNRCEGLLDHHKISGRFDLIGFYTSTLTREYPNTITIQVPGMGSTNPNVEVQSFYRNYRLDKLQLRSKTGEARFPLDTEILRKASVPPYTLRALAYAVVGSSRTYFPVILEKPAAQYQFVLYSPQRQEFPTLEIRRNGQVLYSNPRRIPKQGQIFFTWEYGNAPAGTYELHVVNGEGRRRVYRFRHNPNWF